MSGIQKYDIGGVAGLMRAALAAESLELVPAHAQGLDWAPADQTPGRATWALIRKGEDDSQSLSRVLFTGRYWMTRERFTQWKSAPLGERPISALVGERKPAPQVIEGLEVLELGSAGEDRDAIDELAKLAEMARMTLNVNVVRLARPSHVARGAVAGRIVAVSDAFAAQSVGSNGVVVHEKSRLSREVSVGEQVTMNYANGRAEVLNGLFFDVDVSAPFLSAEQRSFLRARMIEALSGIEYAEHEDSVVREALRYAIDRTVQAYGSELAPIEEASIRLAVTDPVPGLQVRELERIGLDLEPLDSAHDYARQRANA